MKAHKCDRCGKMNTGDPDSILSFDFRTSRLNFQTVDNRRELCDECTADFMRWVRNVEKAG